MTQYGKLCYYVRVTSQLLSFGQLCSVFIFWMTLFNFLIPLSFSFFTFSSNTFLFLFIISSLVNNLWEVIILLNFGLCLPSLVDSSVYSAVALQSSSTQTICCDLFPFVVPPIPTGEEELDEYVTYLCNAIDCTGRTRKVTKYRLFYMFLYWKSFNTAL